MVVPAPVKEKPTVAPVVVKEEKQVETPPAETPKAKSAAPPTLVVTKDEFAYLDNEEVCENGAGSTHYFKAIPKKKSISVQNGSIADDEMRSIQVHVDKNITVSVLKTLLEPVIMVSKDYFKVDRSRSETMRLSETLSSIA